MELPRHPPPRTRPRTARRLPRPNSADRPKAVICCSLRWGSTGSEKAPTRQGIARRGRGLGSPAALYPRPRGSGRSVWSISTWWRFPTCSARSSTGPRDVGHPKLEAAERRLSNLNPEVKIHPFAEHLTSENALEILRPFDVVVDGTDNFPTRATSSTTRAFCWESPTCRFDLSFRGTGERLRLAPGDRAIGAFTPEPPPPHPVPSCAEGGVLGVLPRSHWRHPGDRDGQVGAGDR